MKTEQLFIRLEPGVKRSLELIAKERGESMSLVIRDAIRRMERERARQGDRAPVVQEAQ